ncbi:MAG: site-2 protease family protein [Actinomycetota bacterium]|nr:site-2 protease family protein [Actinomycetota bacterium]
MSGRPPVVEPDAGAGPSTPAGGVRAAAPSDAGPGQPGAPGAASASPRRSLVELVVVAALVVALFVIFGAGDLLVVIACLIVMVMVHELGHLLAAKHGGMKVTEYFLGFGPRLWSIRRGETEYGIKAIPAGGYVKIPGMTNLDEVDPADEARTYREQPFHARLLVAVAGSAMHFIMAFLMLWSLLVFVGVAQTGKLQVQGLVPVAGVANPAAAGGIRPGDIVVSVDGRPVGGSVSTLATVIQDHAGRPVHVVVERDGVRRRLTVTPVNERLHHEAGVVTPAKGAPDGVIGVELGNPTAVEGVVSAVPAAVGDLGRFAWASIVGVGRLFSPTAMLSRFHQVASARAANRAEANGTRVSSIVGAVQVADQAAHAGVGDLLAVLISINVFIGVFNLFPMLPLDGGHVLIAVYERVRSRRGRTYHADVGKLMPFTWLMLAFLGILFVTTLAVDVVHPIANPFG